MYDECRRNSFTFIDNGAVTENKLWVYGIHLQESGKRFIANNLINSFAQVVSMKENLLLSESESFRQNKIVILREVWQISLKRSPVTQF